jgi:hypothetical protein
VVFVVTGASSAGFSGAVNGAIGAVLGANALGADVAGGGAAFAAGAAFLGSINFFCAAFGSSGVTVPAAFVSVFACTFGTFGCA